MHTRKLGILLVRVRAGISIPLKWFNQKRPTINESVFMDKEPIMNVEGNTEKMLPLQAKSGNSCSHGAGATQLKM